MAALVVEHAAAAFPALAHVGEVQAHQAVCRLVEQVGRVVGERPGRSIRRPRRRGRGLGEY